MKAQLGPNNPGPEQTHTPAESEDMQKLKKEAAKKANKARQADIQRDTEKLTRSKYEAGSGNAVDLAKATAQAASTEANVPTYQAALAADIHRLGILLGMICLLGGLIPRLSKADSSLSSE